MKAFLLIISCTLFHVYFYAQVNVTASSGVTSGAYTNLKSAFDAINLGTHSGVINILIGTAGNQVITESAQPVLNKSGVGSANYTSIQINPAFSNITITGSFAGACCTPTGLINLNAANNVIIDGRIGSSGATIDLTIENSNTGAWASSIIFNGASNNTIRYCNIKSSGLGTSAGVATLSFLYNGTTLSSAQNNTIEYCNITKSGANNPNVAIASNSTNSTSKNSGNLIQYNNIFDFKRYGIWLGNSGITTYDDLWQIRNNNFYETGTITINSTDYANYAIMIGYHNSTATTFYNTTGKIIISNNNIGGNGSGGNWTVTSTLANSGLTVGGIYIGASSTLYSEVYGNEIKNFNVGTFNSDQSSLSLPGFHGIYVKNSKVKMGTPTGNKIYNITLDHKYTSWSGIVSGIYISTNTNYSNIIKNNQVYNINAETGTGYFQYFYGIYSYAGSSVFADSVVGNVVTKINIKTNSNCWGIYGSGYMAQNHISKIKNDNGTSDLTGIQYYGVPSASVSLMRVDNNEVILGLDSSNNSTAQNRSIYGIVINGVGQAFYNSVLIQGTHAGSTKTFALKLNTSSGPGFVATNNLLYNARNGGTGKHYCILTTGTNTITSSNNAYIFEGSNSYLGLWNNATDCALLVNWVAVSSETNSISDTKTNKPIASFLPNANLGSGNNLFPADNGWLCAGKVVSQTTDFINVLRNSTNPTTIGAYELNCLVILPITLLSFEAELINDVVELNWITGSEENNDHFIIQRSDDALEWKNIGVVKAAGNSSIQNSYRFKDYSPINGLNYYRLKQYDKNYIFSYSYIVSVDNTKKSNNAILYPNPGKGEINVSIKNTYINQIKEIRIINSVGELVLLENDFNDKDVSIARINISNLSTGVYFVVISDGFNKLTNKLNVIE